MVRNVLKHYFDLLLLSSYCLLSSNLSSFHFNTIRRFGEKKDDSFSLNEQIKNQVSIDDNEYVSKLKG